MEYKLWKTKLFVLGLKLCAWKIRTFAINRYFANLIREYCNSDMLMKCLGV